MTGDQPQGPKRGRAWPILVPVALILGASVTCVAYSVLSPVGYLAGPLMAAAVCGVFAFAGMVWLVFALLARRRTLSRAAERLLLGLALAVSGLVFAVPGLVLLSNAPRGYPPSVPPLLAWTAAAFAVLGAIGFAAAVWRFWTTPHN